jgi:hypothetical protein
MDAETWYTAQEAVDAGLATSVGDIVVDAPKFAQAMYGGRQEGDRLSQPSAGTRTPAKIASREIRLQQMKAMFWTIKKN